MKGWEEGAWNPDPMELSQHLRKEREAQGQTIQPGAGVGVCGELRIQDGWGKLSGAKKA